MKNEARDAIKRVNKLLKDKTISSYHIAHETGLSNSQIIRMRQMDNLDKIRASTLVKIIDYINEVESDPFRTK